MARPLRNYPDHAGELIRARHLSFRISQTLLPLAGAAAVLASCGSEHRPSGPVSILSFGILTAESEPDRHIMVLGEPASVTVSTWTDDCILESPCPVNVSVDLRSSNSGVVTPAMNHVTTPASVALVAHAPGTAVISASVEGHVSSGRVDVLTEPLPLDAVIVRLEPAWNDLPVEYDASQSLASVEVPVGQTAALHIGALRNGVGVSGIVYTINSSAPAVALGTLGCRPPDIDPSCGVASDGWITGITSGDAQITISGRNVSTAFTAHVVPAAP